MSKDRYEERIRVWLADDYRRPARFWRWLRGYYHNRIPRDFRLIHLGHWLTKTGLASSAPGFAYFYGSITGGVAIIAGIAFFCGHSFVSLIGRFATDSAIKPTQNQSEVLVRFGDLLAAFKTNPVPAANKDDAIRACLGILENFSRQIAKSPKGDVSVSLVLYVGNSTTQMRIRHRNSGNERPINRAFDGSSLLGHHACNAEALPRVVHDIRSFGKSALKSPTQSKVDYRSIFIIPLEVENNEVKRVRGFVSIDCKRPFAFYGNRADAIIVTCQPIVSHIKELI